MPPLPAAEAGTAWEGGGALAEGTAGVPQVAQLSALPPAADAEAATGELEKSISEPSKPPVARGAMFRAVIGLGAPADEPAPCSVTPRRGTGEQL